MIDIGANLTDKSFSHDLDQVLARSRASGVDHIIVTGTDLQGSRKAISICRKHPDRLSSTVGIHPHNAAKLTSGWEDTIKELVQERCVVALGETGLDYFRDFSPREIQRNVFAAQLELATELNLPVFIHDRDSSGDLLRIVSEFTQLCGVVHCFTGSAELLSKYLDLGLYIGITGWICDERRGTELKESAHLIPDDRLLIETDAPYLLPRTIRPRPKSRRNEPENLRYVAESVAEARNQSVEHVAKVTSDNARRLFSVQ